ncbi:MAG: hypothetical protein Tsb0021_02050 [Chlamydiales bacterium]
MIHHLSTHLPPSSLFTTCIYDSVREGQRLDFAQHTLHHLGEVIISCSFLPGVLRNRFVYDTEVYFRDFTLGGPWRFDNIDDNEWRRYQSSHGKSDLHDKILRTSGKLYLLFLTIASVATVAQFIFPLYQVSILFPLQALGFATIVMTAIYVSGCALKVFSYYLSKRVRHIYDNFEQISPPVHFPERHRCVLTTSPENPDSALENLPNDILKGNLLPKLSLKDKVALSQTSKTLHARILSDQKTATLVQFSKFFDHSFLNAFGKSALGEDILYDILSEPALPINYVCWADHFTEKRKPEAIHPSKYLDPVDLKTKTAGWGIDKDKRLYFIFLEEADPENLPSITYGYYNNRIYYCMHAIRASKEFEEPNEESYRYHYNRFGSIASASLKSVANDTETQSYLGHTAQVSSGGEEFTLKPILNPQVIESLNLPFGVPNPLYHFPYR